MSFLLPLALLIGLTVVFPLLAHALRKGQATPLPFPGTRLVPSKTTTAKKRHRLEDKFLLLLRIVLLLCLALLAATPFVKCSRLSLSRTEGASVAASLIIDDSASMRAETSEGISRLDAALRGASQLLDTARAGDSFSIILAGYPARILTSTTTELGSVKEALGTVTPSDRRTDLRSALELARGLQKDTPQKDKPIVLLSDLSSGEASSLDLTGVLLPDAHLREALQNCALLSAVRSPDAVQVEVGCTDEEAIADRKLQIFRPDGEGVGLPVAAQDGAARIPLPKAQKAKSAEKMKSAGKRGEPLAERLEVRLGPSPQGKDDIKEDDQTIVLENSAAMNIGLRADAGKAGLKTGSGTVLQAALEALDRGLRVQNLSLLPEDPQELDTLGGLVIDDPSGFTPEVRDALSTWVKAGGVGLLFLGPGIARTPLGSDFSPFLLSSPTWVASKSKGVDPKEAGALGPLTTTWNDLGVTRRAVTPEENVQVLARFDDGAPLVVERMHGRGLLVTVMLPSSIDESDLALRPAFLELLDYVTSQSALRRGSLATPVGERWNTGPGVVVRGPDGREVERRQRLFETEETTRLRGEYVEPAIAGRYVFEYPGDESQTRSERIAMRDLLEHVSQPGAVPEDADFEKQSASLAQVEISREIALLALVLGALELGFRAFSRRRRHHPLQESVS